MLKLPTTLKMSYYDINKHDQGEQARRLVTPHSLVPKEVTIAMLKATRLDEQFFAEYPYETTNIRPSIPFEFGIEPAEDWCSGTLVMIERKATGGFRSIRTPIPYGEKGLRKLAKLRLIGFRGLYASLNKPFEDSFQA